MIMNQRIIVFFLFLLSTGLLQSQPIRLHPENPHYFLYKGQPLVLVTSAEHYGAVLNADFDFAKYLQTLADEGMNYTRIFIGSYVEIPGSFGIENNTLAPATGSFVAPWKRTDETGLYENEKKFDLSEWNPNYFERLKEFISLAEKLDIIVEVTFFCSTYQDAYWERNPFNPGNNVNNLPENLDRKKSNTPNNGNLFKFQKELVEKVVTVLNENDNVFYEIQNEPWADNGVNVMRTLRTLDPNPGEGGWYKWAEKGSDASLEWQREIAKIVVETEKNLPKKHLIAQNFTNFKHSLAEVDENIDILNFHYAWPEAVWMNYAWNRPVGFDESGFAGSDDETYHRQAWQFMLAGGAVFNNLDYSFFVGAEDGTGKNNAPGGGSTELRKQLKFLHEFVESFDFVKMQPDFDVVKHSPGLEWQAISEPGEQYAVVFNGVPAEWIKLQLPKGRFNYQFISPYSGLKLKSGFITVGKNEVTKMKLPGFENMVVLKIEKRK
jgi:hypothetical protein